MSKEDKKWTVYIHTNKENQKRYVGITGEKNLNRRWRKDGAGYKRCTYFYRAICKHGWDNFEHTIYAKDLQEKEAKEIERLLIKILRTQDKRFGYNITDGGDGRTGGIPANRRSVCRFDLEGNYIDEFISLKEAGNAVGKKNISSITGACRKNYFSSSGYCWRYKDDCYNLDDVKKEIIEQKKQMNDASIKAKRSVGRPIYQLDENGNVISVFRSIGYVTEAFGCSADAILYACRKKVTRIGYRWLYEDDYKKFKNGELQIPDFVPRYKHVLQFDLDGNFIQEFDSAKEASEKYGLCKGGVSSACLHHRTSGGYFWRYKDDYKDGDKFIISKGKEVVQLSMDGEFIERYTTASEAKRKVGYDVSSTCRGKQNTAHGYIWMYADVYDSFDKKSLENEVAKRKVKKVKKFTHSCKHIFQFDKQMNFVKEYSCAKEASNETGVPNKLIESACWSLGESHGFLWRYEDNCIKNDDGSLFPIMNEEHGHVIQFSPNMEFIKEYSSSKDAAIATGLDKYRLMASCYKKHSYRGFEWRWADEVEMGGENGNEEVTNTCSAI